MNGAEIISTANKFANSYLKNGSCLNSAIANVAKKDKLSKTEIERLVEETNKATFLLLLERKGEQVFPIADYDKIKSILSPNIEKTASEVINFEPMSYSNSNFRSQLGNYQQNTIVKEASVKKYEDREVAYIEALCKIASEYLEEYSEMMKLNTLTHRRYNYSTDMMKTAEANNDTEVLRIRDVEANLIKKAAIFENILSTMEKSGGFFGELNPIRAFLKSGSPLIAAGAAMNLGTAATVGLPLALAGGAAKLAIGGAAKAAPAALPFIANKGVKNFGTTLTLTSEGSKAAHLANAARKAPSVVGPAAYIAKEANENSIKEKQAFIAPLLEAGAGMLSGPIGQSALKWGGRLMGASDVVSKIAKPITSIGPGASLLKSANFMDTVIGKFNSTNMLNGMSHVTDLAVPALMTGVAAREFFPIGFLGGLAAAAAKKIGGGIALTMNKKEFDHSFNTIMRNNPEFANDRAKVRGYFDVVANSAPSLAKDPLVAENLVKNMNAYGGVDFNTIAALKKTESTGQFPPSDNGMNRIKPLSFSRK